MDADSTTNHTGLARGTVCLGAGPLREDRAFPHKSDERGEKVPACSLFSLLPKGNHGWDRDRLLSQTWTRPFQDSPTSSTRRRSSFCSSMRRCRWCRRCLMCASGSRCCCCCSCCCCCFKASELLLFSCWSRRNSRRSVDSPGTFIMELGQGGIVGGWGQNLTPES